LLRFSREAVKEKHPFAFTRNVLKIFLVRALVKE